MGLDLLNGYYCVNNICNALANAEKGSLVVRTPHSIHVHTFQICLWSEVFCYVVVLIAPQGSSVLLWSRVVRPYVSRTALTFHIFDFSSDIPEQNSTKLDWK